MIPRFNKKSLFGYKCIRFKSKEQFMSSTATKTKDVLDVRLSKLAQMLDCTHYTAREIITRNSSILAMNFSEFLRNAKFCGQSLKLSDVVEFPCLLSMNSSLLQHRYLSLKELGCTNVSGSTILKWVQSRLFYFIYIYLKNLKLCLEKFSKYTGWRLDFLC